MRDLDEKITQVISEHLPEAFVNEFKKFYDKASRTETELAAATKALESQNEEIARLKAENDELEQLKIDRENLDMELENLRKREQAINLTILETKNNMLAANTERLFQLVDKVFGHPSVTVSSNKNVPLAVDGGSCGCGVVQTALETSEETRTLHKR